MVAAIPARWLVRSPARWLVRSPARWLVRSPARWLVRSPARWLVRSPGAGRGLLYQCPLQAAAVIIAFLKDSVVAQ